MNVSDHQTETGAAAIHPAQHAAQHGPSVPSKRLRGNFGTRVPMGKEKKAKEKKGKEDKVVVVEFKVSMHCNACERTVAKAISKINGVEKFVTDMTRHRVVVTGKIKPEKVLEKLRKKTGKRVEIVSNKEDSKDPPKEEDSSIDGLPKDVITRSTVLGYCGDDYLYMMFSDENANACSIM